jgi:hypothetical protein
MSRRDSSLASFPLYLEVQDVTLDQIGVGLVPIGDIGAARSAGELPAPRAWATCVLECDCLDEFREAVKDDQAARVSTGWPPVHEMRALVVLGKHDGSLSRTKTIVHRVHAARGDLQPIGLREDTQAERAQGRPVVAGYLERDVPRRPFTGTEFIFLPPICHCVALALPMCHCVGGALREEAEVPAGGAAEECEVRS